MLKLCSRSSSGRKRREAVAGAGQRTNNLICLEIENLVSWSGPFLSSFGEGVQRKEQVSEVWYVNKYVECNAHWDDEYKNGGRKQGWRQLTL